MVAPSLRGTKKTRRTRPLPVADDPWEAPLRTRTAGEVALMAVQVHVLDLRVEAILGQAGRDEECRSDAAVTAPGAEEPEPDDRRPSRPRLFFFACFVFWVFFVVFVFLFFAFHAWLMALMTAAAKFSNSAALSIMPLWMPGHRPSCLAKWRVAGSMKARTSYSWSSSTPHVDQPRLTHTTNGGGKAVVAAGRAFLGDGGVFECPRRLPIGL